MKVITKYVSRQIISIFILCQFIIVLLYLVIDFIRGIDDFIEADALQLSLVLPFFLYQIPFIVMQMTPVATMISITVVICQMKKNKEIMAMKACGLNLYKALQPVIVLSSIVSIFYFFLSEMIVPYTSTRSNEIMEIKVKKKPQASFREWYKSKNNSIFRIPHYDEETKTINDPVFYFFDDQFNLTKKISGKTCRWLGDVWEVENAKILTREKDGSYSPTVKQPRYILKIPETPETFSAEKTEPEDMNYEELKKRAEKQKAQGYDNTTDLVNLYRKVSDSFISLVLALIAIPLGLWEKTENLPLSITLGMLNIVIFWVVMSITNAIGLAGTLPPFLSAWTANILFTLFGTYLLMNIKR